MPKSRFTPPPNCLSSKRCHEAGAVVLVVRCHHEPLDAPMAVVNTPVEFGMPSKPIDVSTHWPTLVPTACGRAGSPERFWTRTSVVVPVTPTSMVAHINECVVGPPHAVQVRQSVDALDWEPLDEPLEEPLEPPVVVPPFFFPFPLPFPPAAAGEGAVSVITATRASREREKRGERIVVEERTGPRECSPNAFSLDRSVDGLERAASRQRIVNGAVASRRMRQPPSGWRSQTRT